MRTTETQNHLIQAHLEKGMTLTPLEALRLFGCFRLSGRIWDLKRKGIPIETRLIMTTDGKRVAEYFIRKA